MIRTIIISLLCMLGAISANGQHFTEIGTWEVFPVFAPPAQKVIDTGNIVYYLSGGNLFEYNPQTDESYSYTRNNKLTGFEVYNIYYNYDKKYLLVVYDDGNMDVLYPSGKLINISDLSDSEVTRPLKVNDVAFDGDRMYLATSFGVVEYNMVRHEVVQSGVWNVNVSGIEVMDNHVVALVDGQGLMSVPVGNIFATINTLDFIMEADPVLEIKSPGPGMAVLRRSRVPGKNMDRVKIDFESSTGEITVSSGVYTTYPIMQGKNNALYVRGDGFFYSFNPDGSMKSMGAVPEPVINDMLGMYAGREKIWALNSEGLACYGIGADGSVNMYRQRIRPSRRSVKNAHYFLPTSDSRKLYVFNVGASRYKFKVGQASGYYTPLTVDLIDMDRDEANAMAPFPVESQGPSFKNYQATVGKYILSPVSLCVDPDDVETYYVGTNGDGIYKVSHGEVTGYYGADNAPMELVDNRWIAYGVSIDRGGNLWMVTNNNGGASKTIHILPAAKRALPTDQVKPEDWYSPDIPNNVGHMDFRMLHCKQSNMIFMLDTNPNVQMLAYDTKGTFNDFSDDEFRVWTEFVDQDNRVYNPTEQNVLVEDMNGKVWFGTNNGIVEISNPSNATDPGMRINHLKVPRNDGTNDADYLLGSSSVMDIAVDAANRKWAATSESGLYLVSAAGDAILEHYGAENSMLPSDYVNSVYADPMTNYLYVGTDNGVLRLSTDASPAMDNYDEVYAFPNPVRPEHRGDVYVKGLMDNSLVKITDAVGNVVHQGMSEGGMFRWDACDRTGRRVRTGVYYVYMSQGGEGGSSGAVTKILVVN